MANALTSRAIFTVLALTLSGPVLAQGGPGMMGGRGGDGQGWGGMGWHMWGGPGSGWGGGWQQWGRGPEGMLDRIDGRLAFLKTELKITDAQQTQWTRFADAMRTNAKSMNERMKSIWSGEEKAKTLTERLDLHEQMMTARLEEVRQLKSAFADLYAVLDDQQKKEADTLALPMMGMGGGGPMGPGMMWRRG